jgi:GNAT superfamily N-acetyltransferase
MTTGQGAPTIRKARPGEAAQLTALALRSKAHWGYDEIFLDSVRQILTFSEADLANELVFVLEVGEEPVGMYRLIGRPPHGELADLWIEPGHVRRGLGRELFRHARDTAADHSFSTLLIESDPNAEGFYIAMGATRVGERRSPSGRDLPLMEVATESRSRT